MTETTIVSNSHAHFGRLARTRLATRAAMFVERLWPLLLPVLLVAAMFLSLSWLGLFRLLPDLLRLAIGAGFAIGALAALYPLRLFRRPTAIEIDRRLVVRFDQRSDERAYHARPLGLENLSVAVEECGPAR